MQVQVLEQLRGMRGSALQGGAIHLHIFEREWLVREFPTDCETSGSSNP